LSKSRPYLQTLIFEITQRCNHNCLFCYNVWHDEATGQSSCYPKGELDTKGTLTLLNKALDETNCKHITLTGGEPLLRPDLKQILDLLAERDVRVTIISNGRLLTETAIVDMVERGVVLFEIPLLSHHRETHDFLSGASGAFDAALAAMTRIRCNHGKFISVFVATKLNLTHLYNSIKIAFSFGASGLMLNRFNVGGRGRKHMDKLLPSPSQVNQMLTVANEVSVELNFPISCSIAIQPCLVNIDAYPNLNFGFCAAGTQHAYYTLDPLGNLRPCNHTTTILGNLLEETFVDLIAPERLAPFVKAVPDFCSSCKLRKTCKGGCKAAAEVCYGSLSSEEPFLKQNKALARPLLDLNN